MGLSSLRAAVRATIDAAFGEEVLIEPQKTSQYRGSGPDPDRLPFTVRCPMVVDAGEDEDLVAGDSLTPGVSIPAGGAAFHIDGSVYPAAMTIEKSDRLTVIATGQRYEVLDTYPRPAHRAIIIGGSL